MSVSSSSRTATPPAQSNGVATRSFDHFVTYKAFIPIMIAVILAGAGMTSYVLNLFAENTKTADEVLKTQVEAVDKRVGRAENTVSNRLSRIEDKLDLVLTQGANE